MNASKFFGTSIISIGEVFPDRLSGAHSQVLTDKEGAYRKLIYREGRLVGALLFGDIAGAGVFYRLYREGIDLEGRTAEDFMDFADLCFPQTAETLDSSGVS